MPTTSQIRYANFMTLWTAFCDQHGLPEHGALRQFADAIGVSAAYASHIKCARKHIGHALARKLEQAMRKPVGWMDIPHPANVFTIANEEQFMELARAFYRRQPERAANWLLTCLREESPPTTR